MKQFDPSSIQTRLVNILSNSVNWSQILKDSALTSLLGAISESEAELARYFEYLLRESKWQYAQNLSSLLTEAPYLGYVPQRKVSSIGTLTISHSSFLAAAGVTVFRKSDLDTLIPAYAGSPTMITIPQRTSVYTSNGIYFVTSEKAVYTTGDKYIDIPIIQGIIKSQSTTMLGNPFETIGIPSDALSGYVEAADNSISSDFFSVYVTASGTTTPVKYTRFEDIYLADYNELAYEVSVSKDFSTVTVMFGNGTAGALVPANSVVRIDYLSTLGENGNVNDSYVINNLETQLGDTKFFLTNFEAALGGSSEDTLEEIRSKAPLQYLINGSIITADAYKRVIESIPYVKLAKVYASLYTDPITQVTQNAIMYSALSVTGTAPPTSISNDVFAITENKIAPLDFVIYEAPRFLHMKFGVKARSSEKVTGEISTIIKSNIYSEYGILNQAFQQSFDKSSLIAFISNSTELSQIATTIEAVCDLPVGDFVPNPSIAGYYYHNFSFDRSYVKLSGFTDGELYCLKVQIKFLCAGCTDNSRTLFMVRDYTSNNSISCSFAVSNAATGNIIVCGTPVAVNSEDVSSPTKLAIKIAAQTIAGYTITNPSPGIVTLIADPLTAAASISTAIEGITIQSIELTSYKVLQYPLIENITDKDYMTDFVLNADVEPYEILSGNGSTQMATSYIPFLLSLDYFSLASSDPDITPLASGTLAIPETITGSIPYLVFSNSTPDWLNENVQVQVMAIPYRDVVDSYYPNNILLINEEDITVEVS